MGCPQHPSAATVSHPSLPNEKRCATCSELVAGPAGAPRNLHAAGRSCLLVSIAALAAAAVLVVRGRAAYAAAPAGPIFARDVVGVLAVLAVVLGGAGLAIIAIHLARRQRAHQLDAIAHTFDSPELRIERTGSTYLPVVRTAPPRCLIHGEVLREAGSSSSHVSFERTFGGTVLRFGTDGHGEGRVAYRLGPLYSHQPDVYHATRIE